jgi:hypothetical protein
VLKHGKGASYRKLLDIKSPLFGVKQTEDINADETDAPVSLVDVTGSEFFDGLTATILEAYHFLENR